MTLSKALFIAATSLAVSTPAFAQDADSESESGSESTESEAPAEPAAEPAASEDGGEMPAAGEGAMLTLGKGKILITGSTVNINLSADLVGKPISLAPSVYYGVNEKLTVGVTHDGGSTSWTPRPASGAGICITGEDNGCAKAYDNVGLDALYAVSQGKFSLAAHPGLDIRSFDPFTLALRLGVLGHYGINEKIGIVFDPRLSIGLNERDAGLETAGNKEVLDIPVWVWFKASPQLSAYASTGIAGPLDGFGDAYAIPLGVGATYKVNEKLGAGVDFQFVNLLGNGSSGDYRQLGIRAEYAL